MQVAIHNLPTRAERELALREIVRVLRVGGRVVLLDFRSTGTYARTLRAAGMADVRRSWPILWMFPWVWIVRGRKAG